MMAVPRTAPHWMVPLLVCAAVSTNSLATTEEYTNRCTLPLTISNGVMSVSGTTVRYTCNDGYSLSGPALRRCVDNTTWEPPQQPSCVSLLAATNPTTCVEPYVGLGVVVPQVPAGYDAYTYITVHCDDSYGIMFDNKVLPLVRLQCRLNGNWTYHGWNINPQCTVRVCGVAPDIPHAVMDADLGGGYRQHVTYTCNSGYTLVQPGSNSLLCQGGEWTGDLPSCVPIEDCDTPAVVRNAVQKLCIGYCYQRYPVGTEVTYKCNAGYKMVGPSTLQCLQSSLWSHSPPSCMPEKEHLMYCPSVGSILSGNCVCETKSDLSFCEPFYQGLRVECSCNAGYKLIGQPIVTCYKNGKWDFKMPTCVEDMEINSKTDAPTEESSHMSTLAIVVATACSVLGVLLLTMVIMVFRRRKPHPPRLIRPSSTPPPYSRVHGSGGGLDEHDRVLLIGYENSNIQLPTYEEATVGRPLPAGGQAGPGQVGEYRQLPSIPNNYRSSQSVNGEASNRHSIITTSTMNRDGLSEGFGSIDTVNVSMSDASTAVTISTLDSAGSHHSNISRRATAGSLSSSNGSIVMEDAPLLENNQRTEEIDLGVTDSDAQDKIDN